MQPILFSTPNFIDKEIEALCELFARGLARFHLRKEINHYSILKEYLTKIPVKYHQNIIIHQETKLLANFPSLAGLHFNKKIPVSLSLMEKYPDKIFTQATHTFEELENLEEKINYAFLSPIYQSISKINYPAAFSEESLRNFFANYNRNCKIVALGGIDDKNINSTLSMGFDNVAILGYLWQDFEKNGNMQAFIEKWEILLEKIK